MDKNTDLTDGIPAKEDGNQTPNEPQNNYPKPTEEDNNQTLVEAGNKYPASVQDDKTGIQDILFEEELLPEETRQKLKAYVMAMLPIIPRPYNEMTFTDVYRELQGKNKAKVDELVSNLIEGKVFLINTKDEVKETTARWHLDPGYAIMQKFSSSEERDSSVELFVDYVALKKHQRNKNVNPSIIPIGVLLDESQITIENNEVQCEIEEYDKTYKNIKLAVDKKTGRKHIQKFIPIEDFRAEEVKNMILLEKSGLLPRLYLIRLEEEHVVLHMELIRGVPVDRILNLKGSDGFKLFLFVWHKLQAIVRRLFNEYGVIHNDLHDANVLVDFYAEEISVFLVDAGNMRESNDPAELEEELKKAARKVCMHIVGWETSEQKGVLKEKLQDAKEIQKDAPLFMAEAGEEIYKFLEQEATPDPTGTLKLKKSCTLIASESDANQERSLLVTSNESSSKSPLSLSPAPLSTVPNIQGFVAAHRESPANLDVHPHDVQEASPALTSTLKLKKYFTLIASESDANQGRSLLVTSNESSSSPMLLSPPLSPVPDIEAFAGINDPDTTLSGTAPSPAYDEYRLAGFVASNRESPANLDVHPQDVVNAMASADQHVGAQGSAGRDVLWEAEIEALTVLMANMRLA